MFTIQPHLTTMQILAKPNKARLLQNLQREMKLNHVERHLRISLSGKTQRLELDCGLLLVRCTGGCFWPTQPTYLELHPHFDLSQFEIFLPGCRLVLGWWNRLALQPLLESSHRILWVSAGSSVVAPDDIVGAQLVYIDFAGNIIKVISSKSF